MPMAYSKLMSHSQPIAAAHVGEARGEEDDRRDDEDEVHGSPLRSPRCTRGASRFPKPDRAASRDALHSASAWRGASLQVAMAPARVPGAGPPAARAPAAAMSAPSPTAP